MIQRRQLLGLAAALPAAALTNLNGVKSRQVSKWEIIYKSPHAKPNDLSMIREGMWILDQGRENWVSLVNVADGKVIREFKTDVNAASGVTVDEHGVMWISSTHNSLMVSCSPKDGKTIAKYWTPGAGRIYQKKGDAKPRSSKLKPAYPVEPSEAGSGSGAKSELPYGQLPLDTKDGNGGTGAHGIVGQGRLALLRRSSSPVLGCHGAQDLGRAEDVAGTGKSNTWADVGRESRDALERRFQPQRILSLRHEWQDHRKDSAHRRLACDSWRNPA